MAEERTCGEALVALLADYGVEIVFGIPGVHTLELYRGLVDGPIRHVLVRHEQGAGFMADGYARATGKPGVCFLITGPGITNAATPIAQAFSDSVPMLVISSVNHRESLGQGWGELHELSDQRAVTAPMTAFSATAMSPEEVPELLARAFAVFASQRPRPVHIEIPIDLLPMPAGTGWQVATPPAPPQPDTAAVDRAVALLAAAERPLIYAGGGAKGAAGPILDIAEKLAAPVVTTAAGIGVLSGHHPLSLGPTLPRAVTRAEVAAADVVLAVGSELSANDTWGAQPEFGGQLIRIDIDETQLTRRFPAAVALQADAAAALTEIAVDLPQVTDNARRSEAEGRVAAIRAAIEEGLEPLERTHLACLDTVQSLLPRDGLWVGDMTQLVYTAYRSLALDEPGCLLFPKGYGTLGYALPAAIGAKLGAPARAVVTLVGDGGLLYTLQEMATAAEEETAIVVLLWNNEALGAIRDGFLDSAITPIATAPRNPDYLALARAFGWSAERAHGHGELRQLLEAALAASGPSLIELREADFTG